MKDLNFTQKALQISGIYRHYNGGMYQVVCIAFNEATLEEVVIYESIKQPELRWMRPVDVFLEDVQVGDERVKRFTKV